MEDKVDRLFLERDCPLCGVVRAELDMRAASDDGFRGKDGQKLFVFSALSNEASKELLAKFGLAGKTMPVLETWQGEVVSEVKAVLAWLRTNGMSTAS